MSFPGSQSRSVLTPLPAFLDFSLYSNLFVASITTLASYYWQSQIGTVSFHYLAFLFFATLFIYNLEHSQLKKRDLINKPKRSLWLRHNKSKVKVISTFAFVTYLSLFFYEVSHVRSVSTLSMLLISLIYCNDRILKKIPLIKNVLLAIIWASATVLMPQFWLNSPAVSQATWISFSVYFLASFCNSLLCDWNDIQGDSSEGLASLVSRLTPNSFRIIVILISSLLLAISLNSAVAGFSLTALAYSIYAFKKQPTEIYIYDICLVLPLLFMVIP